MKPPTNDPRPPYRQVADAVRRDIEAGRIKPGEQLPSYRELEERFEVASMTARSAVRVLREEGLVYTVQGRGSYVADAVGPGGELIEAKNFTGGQTVDEGESGPDSTQAPGSLTEILHALRDQMRTLNAEVQTLKQEVAELKSRQRS
ncbi:GntR family transcriptional regulator [Streptomyces sp. NBS 14/10]|uniref:GntR family transcriptional regulator n=1 Tax=Streptomyces sp. NBS 14/10 TaxID=1945643 RepID=UPI000B7FF0E9|nr:GntR family transcriptional regulator [Streptomyces sp. NBS 14/10]KAK1180896.1 GntR family transcriptional regulator [Streptomyces sp. NBS 14/10]